MHWRENSASTVCWVCNLWMESWLWDRRNCRGVLKYEWPCRVCAASQSHLTFSLHQVYLQMQSGSTCLPLSSCAQHFTVQAICDKQDLQLQCQSIPTYWWRIWLWRLWWGIRLWLWRRWHQSVSNLCDTNWRRNLSILFGCGEYLIFCSKAHQHAVAPSSTNKMEQDSTYDRSTVAKVDYDRNLLISSRNQQLLFNTGPSSCNWIFIMLCQRWAVCRSSQAHSLELSVLCSEEEGSAMTMMIEEHWLSMTKLIIRCRWSY